MTPKLESAILLKHDLIEPRQVKELKQFIVRNGLKNSSQANSALIMLCDAIDRNGIAFTSLVSKDAKTKHFVSEREIALLKYLIQVYQENQHLDYNVCKKKIREAWQEQIDYQPSSLNNKSKVTGQGILVKRLKQLGLEHCFQGNTDYSDKQFQVNTATALRKSTFQYLRGELDGVQPGPVVIGLKKELAELRRGGLDKQRQKEMEALFAMKSAPGTWAEYTELAILSELLEVNLGIASPVSSGNIALYTQHHNPKEKCDVVLLNKQGAFHWDSQIDGTEVMAAGDGNCGYNAMALSLQSIYNISHSLKNNQQKNHLIDTSKSVSITSHHTPHLRASVSTNTEIVSIKHPTTEKWMLKLQKLALEPKKYQQTVSKIIQKQQEREKQFASPITNNNNSYINAEQARLASLDKLPPKQRAAVKKQVKDDETYALALAAEEMEEEKKFQFGR